MKKSNTPETRVKNSEPNLKSPDWVIWAAWADRVTFEEIKKKTGKWIKTFLCLYDPNLPKSHRGVHVGWPKKGAD